jgi:hypothetical protein
MDCAWVSSWPWASSGPEDFAWSGFFIANSDRAVDFFVGLASGQEDGTGPQCLAVELADGPAAAQGLSFVEGARLGLLDREEPDVMGPGEGEPCVGRLGGG